MKQARYTEEDWKYFEEFLTRRRVIAQREYDKNDDDDFKLPEYIGEPVATERAV